MSQLYVPPPTIPPCNGTSFPFLGPNREGSEVGRGSKVLLVVKK